MQFNKEDIDIGDSHYLVTVYSLGGELPEG